MRPFFSFFRRQNPRSPGGPDEVEFVRSAFSKFRRIQKLNTRALEKMSEMERALGGEYIFDSAFLENSVLELGKIVHQVVYSLNAMGGGRYVGLFDRFESIHGLLENNLHGGPGPYAGNLTLSYPMLSWDLEPVTGAFNVCVAEAKNSLGLSAPDGFAVTTAGCGLLMGRLAESSGSEFPPELREAVAAEMDALHGRIGSPVSLRVVACPAGDRRETSTEFHGRAGVKPENVPQAISDALNEYLLAEGGGGLSDPVAVAVQASVDAFVTGSVVASRAPEYPAGLFRIHAAAADSPNLVEQYLVRRSYPYTLVSSTIGAKPQRQDLYPGIAPLSSAGGGMLRGSAILDPAFLRAVAECAASVERILGWPFQLQWCRGNADRPTITGARFISGQEEPAICEIPNSPPEVQVLFEGGQTAQVGVASGCTVMIPEFPDVLSIPHGAVGIAHSASPSLSFILPRLSALVTEVGSSIGHLAAIARELRVPAVFGATGVLRHVPEGIDVTVDAGERTIYRGVVESLLACRDEGSNLYPDDPEYITLRRLLRLIMPLGLIDPESPSFSVENCRTLHDIIHFAHEKSVEELLNLFDRGRDLAGLNASRLNLKVPIELFVLDLGGGLMVRDGVVSSAQISSAPFKSFISGLESAPMWNQDPAPLRLRDILSGIGRTNASSGGSVGYAGRNHAILAANYMNVGLRLGYHFSVVDSYCGDNPNQNYVYFRFVGGLAQEEQRRRRAVLVGSILDGLRFRTKVEGDLVTGKLKIADSREISRILTCLGELTAFTRQLDLVMEHDETTAGLLGEFRRRSGAAEAESSRA